MGTISLSKTMLSGIECYSISFTRKDSPLATNYFIVISKKEFDTLTEMLKEGFSGADYEEAIK